jgi:hypothetical protein
MLSISTHFYLIICVQSRTFITYEGGQKGSAFVLLYWEVAFFLPVKFYLKKNSQRFTIAKKGIFFFNHQMYIWFLLCTQEYKRMIKYFLFISDL